VFSACNAVPELLARAPEKRSPFDEVPEWLQGFDAVADDFGDGEHRCRADRSYFMLSASSSQTTWLWKDSGFVGVFFSCRRVVCGPAPTAGPPGRAYPVLRLTVAVHPGLAALALAAQVGRSKPIAPDRPS
jgi:hypothetical protein